MTSTEHADLIGLGDLDLEPDDAPTPEPVRARDVRVDKLHRARCLRCDWIGGEHAAYQEANDERLAHLDQHTLGGL